MVERLYSDKEAALLLRRAAELQKVREGIPAARDRGLSLSELEAAAAEAGIPADCLREAARDLEAARAAASNAFKRVFFGAPLASRKEAVLPREVSADELDDLLSRLEDVTGLDGNGTARRGRLSWKADSADSQRRGSRLKIEVEAADGATRIVVSEDLKTLAGGLFGGLMGGLGGSAGANGVVQIGVHSGHWLLGAAVGLAGVAASWLMARAFFLRASRKSAERVERVSEGVSRALSGSAAPRA